MLNKRLDKLLEETMASNEKILAQLQDDAELYHQHVASSFVLYHII